MAEAVLSVAFAGPHVSVQDPGRRGWLRYGVPASGPMDRLAFAAAQTALGNPPDAPAIEISRGGLRLDCLAGETGFALAGAGFILEQAGGRGGSWSRGVLRAGESLTIRPGPWGCWCYLAFAACPAVTPWLGSVATHGPSGLGGGRLKAGGRLVLEGARSGPGPGPIPCPVLARPRHELRVTRGPQERFFAPDALDTLLSARWRVTDSGDRMGQRLSGPRLTPLALDMPSEPLARGAVQVAGDGAATVLMADHQTTGGYPKIATVLDCDLDGFAQLRPGQDLVFREVSPEEAVALARRRAVAVRRWLRTLTLRA